jgi:hypothetical protein
LGSIDSLDYERFLRGEVVAAAGQRTYGTGAAPRRHKGLAKGNVRQDATSERGMCSHVDFATSLIFDVRHTPRESTVGGDSLRFVFSIPCALHYVSSHRPSCYPYIKLVETREASITIEAEHEAEAREEVEDLGPESFPWKSEGIEMERIEETESDEGAVRA